MNVENGICKRLDLKQELDTITICAFIFRKKWIYFKKDNFRRPEQFAHWISLWKDLSWKVPTPQMLHSFLFMYCPSIQPDNGSNRCNWKAIANSLSSIRLTLVNWWIFLIYFKSVFQSCYRPHPKDDGRQCLYFVHHCEVGTTIWLMGGGDYPLPRSMWGVLPSQAGRRYYLSRQGVPLPRCAGGGGYYLSR